ncbi:phage tail spike protein [Bacillus sp. 2205SS5-2]|uniref:phage tail spike protein n=1 Tax=Bacillus sp. 2205SS5-2 TaxID=3109031 RepID=UPI003007A1E3
MIEIYAGSTLIQTIRKVMSANLREALEGEFILSFTVLAKSALALKTKQLAKLNDQYFEIVQITKSLQGSLPVCSVTCEHVSYILNDEIYKIDTFDFTGNPTAGLNQLLSGTPFSAGIVEFSESCTMKINQEVTRRSALMQYIAILGGEIEYDGYQINIKSHRGSSEYKVVMDSKNVTDVSVSHDSRENASSYHISFFKLLSLSVGDNVHIVFRPLGIDVKTRIISLEYNPFYRYDIRVEVGRYRPSISDTFYRIGSSMNSVETSLTQVGSSVDGLQTQVNDLGVSYTVVKSLSIDAGFINVTYEVEKGDTHQYHAKYSYATDTGGRITSITLDDIFSELLLKEVSTLLVDAARFEVTYVDGETASYNYTTDSSGRITAINKVVG